MEFKKIIVLSDTHMHLKDNAWKAIKGEYNSNQIYDNIVFEDSYNNDLIKQSETLNNSYPDLIIHAGDIGSQKIIDMLSGICELVVVNGNCDFNSYKTLNGFTKDFEIVKFYGVSIAITHTPYELERWDKNKNFNLYIHGHTHDPYIEKKDNDSIWICPGSASMGRYGSVDSIAAIYIADSKVVSAQLIEI